MAGRLGVRMIGTAGAWVLRPFGGAADHALVEELRSAALEPRWPLLPRAIAMVRDGFLAMERGRAVGTGALTVALDLRTHEAVAEHSGGRVVRVALTPNRPVRGGDP